MPVPLMLAHLPHSPRKWAQEKPASFQPVSTEVLPANINTLCFAFQHGPGQKATSEPNKKAALPLKETQEEPLVFGFSFPSGWRRQLQLRGSGWPEGKQDVLVAHGGW